MHSHVFYKVGELFVAGDKVGFAINFHEYADSAVMDVRTNQSGAGFAFTAFVSFSHALFAHGFQGLVEVAFGFNQGSFSVGDTYAAEFAEALNVFNFYICHFFFSFSDNSMSF